ncbi:MAG TPA: ABC transporter ATP-binding protein, partial [Firmicutes bacterium]|nr:ABC transporter ATP-binding protein [Bacillota bacterium]
MLKVENLEVYYGNIHALHEVSFEVKEGEIVTLIGANGAGKTSVLHAVSGLIPIRSGSVSFLGQDLTLLAPDKIVQLGLGQVPEGRRIFANLTVKENLEMGAFTRKDPKGIKADYQQVFTRFPRLKER